MSFAALRSLLLLEDYNTRVVVLGVMAIAIAAATLGSFLAVRRQTLLTDTFAHATLPGIAGAFLVAPAFGFDARDPWILFLAAGGSGLLALFAVARLARLPRVREDTALAVVLSSSFGLGSMLLGLVQRAPSGNAAGLSQFLYGKTATLLLEDLHFAAIAAALTLLGVALSFKELRLWAFDPDFARSVGFRLGFVDALFAVLTAWVGVVALRAVGLVLLVALFLGPAAAARCWTSRLSGMVVVAAVLGALAGYGGTILSALAPGLPAGALVVLSCTALFVLSAKFGPERRRARIGRAG